MDLSFRSLGCACRSKQKFLLGERKKKLKSFIAATSVGSTQMTFGDLNPNGIARLDVDIQMFVLYKGFFWMT